ncbi:MAG TPA: four helix bundle protein [Chloroflexia bacterium]
MNYQQWEETVPVEIKGDVLWTVEVYRLALFACAIGWKDVTRLAGDIRTRSLADQLYRSLGSISANFAEGYSRISTKDRARFYEYALGSARESRDWYYKSTGALASEVIAHRIKLLTQIIRLLLVILPRERHHSLRENNVEYDILEAPE